jgi:hypothetical protein
MQLPDGPYVVEVGREKGLTEAGVEVLARLSERGLGKKAMAALLGISTGQLVALIREDPRCTEAFGVGRARLEDALVKTLVDRALDPDEKNVVPLLFAAKSLIGLSETGRPDEHEARPLNVVLVALPTPQRLDAYEPPIIDITPDKKDDEA